MDTKEQKEPIFTRKWFEDFFIPRNITEVVFTLICFALAWYAITYDIPQAKIPIICANVWNEWAQEKAAYFGGMNITPATDFFGACNCDNYINGSLLNLSFNTT